MPQLRFYATKDDLTRVFENMLCELGLIAFELVSEPGEQLRRFHTVTELSAHFRYCGKRSDFVWWHADSMPASRPKKLRLDPEKCDGHTFRYSAEFAMIQVETGLKRSGLLTPSEFGLVTQAYYRSVGGRAKVDWRLLNNQFNQIRKFIEKNTSGKVDGCLVMSGAYDLASGDGRLTESIREGFERFGKKHIRALS